MGKRIRTFLRILLNEQIDFQERLIRMVLLLAFAASIIGMGRVLLGASPIVLIALVPMCIVSGAALRVAVKYHNIKKASWMLVATSNVILFPLLFIMSSGIDSGTQVWLALGLVYIFLLFKGKELAIALVLSMISFLVTYAITYKFP